MNHSFRILLDPKGAEGGDSPPAPDLTKVVEGLLNKHGDPTAALKVLLAENYEYRDSIRTLKGKVPPEGDVVLSGDDTKRWHTYRELGEPSDLRKAVSERDQLRADLGRVRTAEASDQAAELSGYNRRALRRLTAQDGLEYEFRDEKKDGKDTRVPCVKGKDDKGADVLIPLDEYVEKNAPEMLPALRDGQKTAEPQRPPGMPPRRDPPATPPPPGDGMDPIHRETFEHVGYHRM